VAGASSPCHAHHLEHPAANFCRKQVKSSTFSTGTVVLPSQFAYESAAANFCRKHVKIEGR